MKTGSVYTIILYFIDSLNLSGNWTLESVLQMEDTKPDWVNLQLHVHYNMLENIHHCISAFFENEAIMCVQ